MKLRHAVAFALVGWYLLEPPLTNTGVNIHAPLSEWNIVRTFDHADDCEQLLDKIHSWKTLEELKRRDPKNTAGIGLAFAQALETRCIATDDPRLKAN